MLWSNIEGLDNVDNWVIKMTSLPSVKGHDSAKTRFDRFDRFSRHWGIQKCLGLDKWWLIRDVWHASNWLGLTQNG